MKRDYKFIVFITLFILVVLIFNPFGIVSAVPVTGAAGDINSNGFNTTLTGVTGSDCWVFWGEFPGKENWVSPNATAVAGTVTVQVIGAPIYGGETIVFQGCDSTGCGGEQTVTIPAVTVMPTTTYSRLLRNITNSRFNPAIIGASLLSSYTSVTPATIVFGIAFLFGVFGVWMRTKSVRLIAIIGILISPFIMYGSQGLYLGIPLVGQGIAQGLLAAGIAGVLLSFIRK